MWIIAIVGLVALMAGGGLLWHSIGESAVAKHELQQKAEQDKLDAIAETKKEEAAKGLIDMQAAYEAGKAEREIVEKKIYIKGQDIVRTLPAAAKSPDCTIPPAGMAVLNGARGDLQNTTAAEIFGFDKPVEKPVVIHERVPPEQATKPQPVERPAPVNPLKPKP